MRFEGQIPLTDVEKHR